ncbi:carboxypeptidase-like regulatory domain-containing protein [Lutibacter sp.]|uniref:carboxypeptidase-like regulatory domain-containing protein n=1 Tax=Lutibacter sp. TaxID=1925666 RepID=UPI0025BEF4E6|nr:carboxypeptidase-like regulatory domain-containing protein [Lutibacter sp.]MCF6166992.1 carboxypeptidase-like regulatory domain-containing protein [Lutibacter sp.]
MKLKLLFFLTFITFSANSQNFKVNSFFAETIKNGIVKGIVLDGELEKTPLVFAKITVKELAKSINTNTKGKYKLKLKPGTYTLLFDFIGYDTKKVVNVIVKDNTETNLNQTLNASIINNNYSITSLN